MKLLMVIGLICVLGVFAIGVVTGGIARFKASRSTDSLIRRLGPKNVQLVDGTTTFLGLESDGRRQGRTTGALVLTRDELVFEQWRPKRTITVSRPAVTRVSSGRAFLGKTRGKRLLKVTWTLPDGESQQAAWQLHELDTWLTSIRS